MSPASFTTARVMETWAHGLDCFDAAGVTPAYTDRLHHVADLSVRALPYAFMINGVDAPGPCASSSKHRRATHGSSGPTTRRP